VKAVVADPEWLVTDVVEEQLVAAAAATADDTTPATVVPPVKSGELAGATHHANINLAVGNPHSRGGGTNLVAAGGRRPLHP